MKYSIYLSCLFLTLVGKFPRSSKKCQSHFFKGLADLQSTTPKTTPRTTPKTTPRTTPRTTPGPIQSTPISCYACTNCPRPFDKNAYGVRVATSLNGWCSVRICLLIICRK